MYNYIYTRTFKKGVFIMSYSLTNPQNSIWLTEKFYTGTSVNNICGYVYISDSVDFNALKKAINELVKTNDNMRLKFKEENNSCVQYLSEYKSFDIDIIDFSSEKDIRKVASPNVHDASHRHCPR